MWPLGCLVIKSLLEIDYTCIPKPANGVRLRAKLESENPTGLPVGVVSDTACTYHHEGYIPDWDYMEKYIKAIEKLVIKDVVDWKDKEIAATKNVVKKI